MPLDTMGQQQTPNEAKILYLCEKKPSSDGLRLVFGVSDGDRTHDHRNHNPELYQLSYAHHIHYSATSCLARPAGLEPATYGLAYHYHFRDP